MTFDEMVKQVLYALSEDESVDNYHEIEKVKSFLNEAQQRFTAYVEHLQKILVIDGNESGYSYVDINDPLFSKAIKVSDMLNLHRVIYDGKPLDETDIYLVSLLEGDKLIREQPETPNNFIMLTYNQFVLYPSPYVHGSAEEMAIIYARSPSKMEADADEPEIPTPYRPALVDYAIYRGLEKEQDSQRALRYYEAFYNQLDKAKMTMARGLPDSFRNKEQQGTFRNHQEGEPRH